MKVGDLVKQYILYDDGIVKDVEYGVVVEAIDHSVVPPVCRVLWPAGIKKIWSEELEVINEDR